MGAGSLKEILRDPINDLCTALYCRLTSMRLTLSVPLSKLILYWYCYLLFFDLLRRTGTAEEQKKMRDTVNLTIKKNKILIFHLPFNFSACD